SGTRLLRGSFVAGPIFRPEKFAIAVGQGSPLRKRINEALLAIYEDGTYEDIYTKWFSGDVRQLDHGTARRFICARRDRSVSRICSSQRPRETRWRQEVIRAPRRAWLAWPRLSSHITRPLDAAHGEASPTLNNGAAREGYLIQ